MGNGIKHEMIMESLGIILKSKGLQTEKPIYHEIIIITNKFLDIKKYLY